MKPINNFSTKNITLTSYLESAPNKACTLNHITLYTGDFGIMRGVHYFVHLIFLLECHTKVMKHFLIAKHLTVAISC